MFDTDMLNNRYILILDTIIYTMLDNRYMLKNIINTMLYNRYILIYNIYYAG